MVKEIQPKDSIENFWKGIWGEKKACNMSASWIGNIGKGNQEVKEQKWQNITVLELKAALTKSQKWIPPGIDKVPNFWLNALSSSHFTFTRLLNKIMENPKKAPKWMCEGITYLLTKSNDTKDPKNYRPITCLSTTYKSLTSVLTNKTYSHLEQNNLFPLEQKRCRRGSYGGKDQLMINKMILKNYKKRKRNLSCAWMDYKKAFNSFPHEFILRSLELFKVSPRVVAFLKHNLKNWKTQLILTHESGTLISDNINIKRGILQGDSLSLLLFCISLIPLSLELNSLGYGYKIRNERITHLFYMNDLKLYAKDDNELEGLLRIVKGFSDDIGMEFGLSKCAKATFKRGKLEESDHVRLDEETMIKDLEQEEVYKYLGVDESSGIQHATMKQKLKKELVRRTRLILKTELNSKNRITR